MAEQPSVLAPASDGEPDQTSIISTPQGGRERGLVIHKLFEEVLTSETGDSIEALQTRAADLITEMGIEASDDPSCGLSPVEIAQCVQRGLTHPKIAAVRARLLPEFPVYASSVAGVVERVTVGVADAIAMEGNSPSLLVDWKSDVDPRPETIAHYRAQVSAYLEATKIQVGLIMFVTTGNVVEERHSAA